MFEVHRLGGRGLDSNIYLIVDEKVALVDAGSGKDYDEVRMEIEERGVGPGEIELLINTHCHYDHAGGDLDFVRDFGCKVAIHESEAGYLRSGDWHFTLSDLFFDERMRPVEVSVELREGDVIELGKLRLSVLHTPGHTAGSICLYDPEKQILFSGDTVFAEGMGRTDLPSGDWRKLGESLRRLAGLRVGRIYPGHGPEVEGDGTASIRRVLDAFYPGLR